MKNSYSASIREELLRRGLAELGIPEKSKGTLRACCAAAFLRGAFLCAGVPAGEETALAPGHPELAQLCRHLLERFFGGSGGALSPVLSCESRAALSMGGKDCEDCQKLFLRAAFLACGTVTDPAKEYRAVFRCRSGKAENQVRAALTRFGMEPGTSRTERGSLVYVKRGEDICDLLVAMGDQRHAILLQEKMVEQSFNSQQNRRHNSDLANMQKAVDGAQGVISAIRFLSDRGVLNTLAEPLREAARLRTEHPDMSLKELCATFPGAISKSGLNHRLQKLMAIARELKDKEKTK